MIAIIPERVIGMPRNTDRHRPESPRRLLKFLTFKYSSIFHLPVAILAYLPAVWNLLQGWHIVHGGRVGQLPYSQRHVRGVKLKTRIRKSKSRE